MEVKINKEIRDYTESMFFGLSLRQFVFSVLACLIAVGVYFGLKPLLGLETTMVSFHLPDPEGPDLRQYQRVLQAFAGAEAKAEDAVSQKRKQEERGEEKA